MPKKPLLVTLVSLVGVLTALHQHQVLSAPETEPISEVRLERFVTSGMGPSTRITLRADGTVEYETKFGKRSVRKVGEINTQDFRRLAELVERSGFFNLKERYATTRTHQWMVTTTVKRGGQEKKVVNYGDAAPVELWGIEWAILGLRAEGYWAD